jgi:hypothetical protein
MTNVSPLPAVKIAIGIVFSFALGFLAHLILFGHQRVKQEQQQWQLFGELSVKQQWQVVEQYNAYVHDPRNYTHDPATGLSTTFLPVDPEPSLAALVAAGELSHLDLVLPNVPKTREATHHWMKFCETHKEIVYATGNPSYPSSHSGTEPLHLNLWFRDADRGVAETLIRELRQNYEK